MKEDFVIMSLSLEDEILRIDEMLEDADTVSKLVEVSKKAKEIYELYQSSNKAIYKYFSILRSLIDAQKEEEDRKNTAEEARNVYEKHPQSEAVASEYLIFLNTLLLKQKYKFDWEITVDKVLQVYSQHPLSRRVATDFINVLINLSGKPDEQSGIKNIVEKAKIVYEQYDSIDTAIAYILILNNLSWSQKSLLEREKTVEIASSVFEKYQHIELVAKEYLILLRSLLAKQEDEGEWINTEKKVKRIYQMYTSSERVATQYINFLSNLAWKRESEPERESIVKEARTVYQKYHKSFEVANSFIITLASVAGKTENIEIRSKIIKEADEIYKQHPTSEKVAISYIKLLTNVALNQDNEVEILDIVNIAKLVYEQYQHNENVITWYLKILLFLSWVQEDDNRKKKTNIDIINILQVHTQLIYIFDQHIDIMLNVFIETNEQYELSHSVNLFKHLSEQDKQNNILVKSKYSILTEGNELAFDSEVEILLKIFGLVQIIKQQLVVTNPSSSKFGHYTSGKVLQMFLKQKNKEKDRKGEKNKNHYSIVTKSRLNNVNYMNDPSEGKLLNQILKLDVTSQKSSLRPSPWFLMSLTTSIDQLTMWSQYGDRAEGVCLVLDSGDFSKATSWLDINWLTSRRSSKRLAKELDDSFSVLESESKDFIYRIGYLSKQDNKEFLLKKEHNAYLDVDEINKLLKLLKEIVMDINKESSLYEKVDECLEEIRYLFKSADYSYESELRVLKYMPLEPDNPKIKIDDSGDFAKLYIERDNPIKISEVIFGPKFQNPENVTPLLYLLDKNIEFRQSDISFR
jgi:hypothetical protein